ncbi:MAG TPA: hypothetical protein VGF28_08805 [Thermoanaerobaculia bacterium]|jgi:hypothetical protein
MKQLLILTFSLAVLCPFSASATENANKPPRVSFGPGGVTVGDLKPGTHVAWMAVIREPRNFHVATRILRGYGPATPNSDFAIAHEAADEASGIWTVVDVDSGSAVHTKPETMVMSRRPIRIEAISGETSVRIGSNAVEVLYVRPRRGAWTFSGADGGGLDADGEQNGAVVMRLQSLQRLKGNPEPPGAVEGGDLVLVIDPRRLRTATFEVQP